MWNSLKRFWIFDDPRSYGARAILREAVAGLRSIGKDVHVFSFDPTTPDSHAQLRQHLFATKPDVILLANHPATLFLQQIGLKEAPCQTITWIFDDPFIMGREPFSDREIVFVADPSFAEAAKNRGANRVHFVPVAAPVEGKAEYRSKYDFPVVYVGATSNVSEMRNQLTKEMADYLDQIIQLKIHSPSTSFQHLLDQHPFQNSQHIKVGGQLAYYLYAESNRRSRLAFLKPLTNDELGLFGNPQWIPQIQGTSLESCFQGSIDPFDEYPHLIHSAKINLNLRSLQGYSVPTQRDFWVPHYEGFMISTQIVSHEMDWSVADPENRFQLDQFPWSPSEKEPEALAQRVWELLVNSDKRKEWVEYASMQVQTHHNFARRMEQLGKIV